MALSQAAVIKLILKYIGGSKIKGATTTTVEGKPVIVKNSSLNELASRIGQYGNSIEEVRNAIFNNPKATKIEEVRQNIQSLSTIAANSSATQSNQDTVTDAVTSFQTKLDRYLLHTNILSGITVIDEIAIDTQAFLDDANAAVDAAELAATEANNAVSAATTAVTDAQQAAADALQSENDAATFASQSATSATNAGISESNASASAGVAATSATNAGNSATSAAASASSASTSAGDAGTFATAAEASSVTAQTAATDAGTSATAAANSATAASASETAAGTSAAAAATSELNAATSESNASISETNAATSATNADGSATSASTSASQAATSATSAGNSATVATTQATNASNSATNASTSEQLAAEFALISSANATAIRLTPNGHFDSDLELWYKDSTVPQTSANGLDTDPDATLVSTYQSSSNVVTNASGQSVDAVSKLITVETARTYQVRARVYHENTNAVFYAGVYCYDASDTLLGIRYPAANGQTGFTGWQEYEGSIVGEGSTQDTFFAGTVKIAVVGRLNFTDHASVTGLDYLYIEDITESTSAALSAAAAQTSSSSASASATSASTSASNAATSEFNAATSETNAAGSASNAAASATNASTSETNASASESNAATSETNAATFATNASNSASAAATSASAAQTSETNASASATAASTSETNAATSAFNAATSETNAAGSATSAATSATNASTSETNASASAASASSSETLAASYRDQSIRTTTIGNTQGFEQPDYFTNSLSGEFPTSIGSGNVVNDATYGDVYQASIHLSVCVREPIATVPGRRYRLHANVRCVTDVSNGGGTNVDIQANSLNSSFGIEANAGTITEQLVPGFDGGRPSLAVADGIVELKQDIIIDASPNHPYIRPRVYFNWGGGGTNGNSTVQVLEFWIEDITESYASEISSQAALTSESNAAASATAASTSESNAATSEFNAGVSETNAAGSASAASTSATNASTSETNASASAASAATSETQAAQFRDDSRLETALQLPSTFDDEGVYWQVGFNFFTQAPYSRPTAETSNSTQNSYPTVTNEGKVLQRVNATGTFEHVAPQGTFIPIAGRRYRFTTRVRQTAGTPGTASLFAVALDGSYGYNPGASSVISTGTLTLNTWEELVLERDGSAFLTGGTVFARPMLRFNQGNSTYQVSTLKVEDITSEFNAETSASAASASEASASADAASASTSETLAAQALFTAELGAAKLWEFNFPADTDLLTADADGEPSTLAKHSDDPDFAGTTANSFKVTRSGGFQSFYPRAVLPKGTRPRTVRSTLIARLSQLPSSGDFDIRVFMRCLNSNYTFVTVTGVSTFYTMSASYQTYTFDMVVPQSIIDNASIEFLKPEMEFGSTTNNLNGGELEVQSWYLEDITESEAAATSATAASSSATSASASEAAASASEASATASSQLAANFASGAINPNANFAVGEIGQNVGSGGAAAGWTNWSGFTANKTYVAGDGVNPVALEMIGDAGLNAGFVLNDAQAVSYPIKPSTYHVIEADVELLAGTWRGAGVYFVGRYSSPTTTNGAVSMSFTGEDNQGVQQGDGTVGDRRTYSIIYETFSLVEYGLLYGMNHWDGFGGAVNNGASGQADKSTANTIKWHSLKIREATQAEIETETVLPAVQASVSVNQAAIATIEGSAAYYEIVTAAGGGDNAVVRLTAGDGGSDIDLSAERIRLYNGSTDVAALSIEGGNVTFTGELNVGTGSGARVNITENLIQVYDANNTLRVRMGVWT